MFDVPSPSPGSGNCVRYRMADKSSKSVMPRFRPARGTVVIHPHEAAEAAPADDGNRHPS